MTDVFVVKRSIGNYQKISETKISATNAREGIRDHKEHDQLSYGRVSLLLTGRTIRESPIEADVKI
jgi:hypothetical protein